MRWCSNISLQGTIPAHFSLTHKFQNTFLLCLWLTESLLYIIPYFSLGMTWKGTKWPFFKTCFVHSLCHICKKRNIALISKYRTKYPLSDSSNFYLAKYSLVQIFLSLSRNNFTDSCICPVWRIDQILGDWTVFARSLPYLSFFVIGSGFFGAEQKYPNG